MNTYYKRPHIGTVIATRFGNVAVRQVIDNGRSVVVDVPGRGLETLTRADGGWWIRAL